MQTTININAEIAKKVAEFAEQKGKNVSNFIEETLLNALEKEQKVEDETAYLLKSEENKKRLLQSLEEAKNGKVRVVNIDNL